MIKRKQVSELRVNPLLLTVGKLQYKTELWNVINLQPFFPPIESLFKTNYLDPVKSFGIKLNDTVISVSNTTAILSSGKTVEVHPKITMLLSPYKWMKGEFGTLGLPGLSKTVDTVHSKLQSPNNAGYVGSILSVALSQSGCQHFPAVYGVFTGISTTHTINISDDYEDLCERSWFSQNIGKTFDLKLDEHIGSSIEYTRSARHTLNFEEGCVDMGDVQILDGIETETTELGNINQIFKGSDELNADDNSSSVSTSYIFQIESMSSSCIYEPEEEEEEEPFAWATFKNVPVQMTIMEKCTDTLYKLFIEYPDPQKQFAWIAQVIFALAYAQRNFAFTHNDLHGNNIMYIRTTQEFLYYFHAGTSYAVPTYGVLLKIIDFDRGIGSVKLPGMKDAKVFMSDQFHVAEEAGGQYNCQPFYVDKHTVIKPNSSFDLVRLATSMFWDLYPNGPKFDEYQEQPLFKLFIRWMTLDDGTSVLFFKNNPKIDRYIGFSLYKAIARYCKDTAVPRKEINELACFTGPIPAGEVPLVIDV